MSISDSNDEAGIEAARTAGEIQAGIGQRGYWLDGGNKNEINHDAAFAQADVMNHLERMAA